MIIRAAIVFAGVLLLIPQGETETGESAPVSGVLSALHTALLEDIAQVRADIAESQRERGGSLLGRI